MRKTTIGTVALAAALLPLAACAPGMAPGTMGPMGGDAAAHAFVSAVDMNEIETSMLAQERAADPAVRLFATMMVSSHTHALQAREARMAQLGMGLGLAADAWTPAGARWSTAPAAGLHPAAGGARPQGQLQPAGMGAGAAATLRHEMALTPAGTLAMREALMAHPASRPVMEMGMQTMQRLQGLGGAEFDSAYMDAQAAMHRDALENLDRMIAAGGVSAEVLGILEATRAAVAGHLEMAQAIRGRM